MIRGICAFLLLLPVAAAPAASQTFRGVVVDDSTKRPLEDVTITLLDDKGVTLLVPPVRTDTTGRFVLQPGKLGKFQIRATRIGYQPLTSAVVSFGPAQQATVNLNMSSVAQRLGAIVVSEKRRLTADELMSGPGFHLRMSTGVGDFLDATALAQLGRQELGSLLTGTTRFGVSADMNGVLQMRSIRTEAHRIAGRPDHSCTPELWLDGALVNRVIKNWDGPTISALEGYSADQIYGIEVYSYQTLPAPNIASRIGKPLVGNPSAGEPGREHEGECGAIVVWTKKFIELEDKKARERELKKANKG